MITPGIHTGFCSVKRGPYFKFTEAISFVVNCESQDEIDYKAGVRQIADQGRTSGENPLRIVFSVMTLGSMNCRR
jgi:hypothetical protein